MLCSLLLLLMLPETLPVDAGPLGSVAPVNGHDRNCCCSSFDNIKEAKGHILLLMMQAASWRVLLVLLLAAVVAGLCHRWREFHTVMQCER